MMPYNYKIRQNAVGFHDILCDDKITNIGGAYFEHDSFWEVGAAVVTCAHVRT